LKDRDTQKRFFSDLNDFYIESKTATVECKKGAERVVEDTLKGRMLYYCDSDSSRIELLAIDLFEAELSGNWVVQVRPNESRSLLSVAHQLPGALSSTIAILKPGTLTLLDSISNVWDHRWVNDSTLLYVRTNKRQRGNKLYLHQLGVARDELLLEESNETFDLNLSESDGQTLVFKRSIMESAWYWVQDSISDRLKLVLPLKHDTDYQLIKAGVWWYRLDLTTHSCPNRFS